MIEIDGQLSIFDFLPKKETHPGIAAIYRYYTERWNMVESSQERCRAWEFAHPVKEDRDFLKVYGDPRFWSFRSCYGCGKTECSEICDRVKPAHFILREKTVRIEDGVRIISHDFYCSECGEELFHNGEMRKKVRICPSCRKRIMNETAKV